MRGSNNYLHKR